MSNLKIENGSSTTGGSAGGVGFCGLLAIVFIVLKLCHVINWSWIWVLSPIWIPVVLIMIFSIIMIVIMNRR